MCRGGANTINAELMLMQEATKEYHNYYHYISGTDLPLMSQTQMKLFFEKENGKEFIGITPGWTDGKSVSTRYTKYWFFQNQIGKNKRNPAYYVFKAIAKIQQKFNFVDRSKKEQQKFCGGPSWFSITHNAACYVLEQRNWIRTRFKNTFCCDEIFMQTVIANSPYFANLYNYDDCYTGCLRYVKFDKESPYILTEKDYDALMKSGCLFARKFDTKLPEQKRLIEMILTHISEDNERENQRCNEHI